MQANDVLPAIKRVAANRRTAALAVSVVVLIWSLVELVNLAFRHTTGPEIYGVLVAALAVLAGALSVVLLLSTRPRMLARMPVVLLWAVVAFGGIAGTVFHATGTGPEAGAVDPRPRPAGARLIFTALGVVGAGALLYGQRSAAATTNQS
jgi:peptidoglycan/LPS O-acetylase OafA/YrhL